MISKRVKATVLALTVVFSSVFANVGAWNTNNNEVKADEVVVGGTCGENVTWTLNRDTGEMLIEGTGEMDDYESEEGSNPTPWDSYLDDIINVKIEEGVKRIGRQAFNQAFNLQSIKIPASVTEIATGDKAWVLKDNHYLTSIIVDEGNLVYDSRENCNAIIESDTNSIIYGCKETIIPDGIEKIAVASFHGSGVTSLTFPSSLKTIERSAFPWSDLESVYIPKTVEYIGDGAFSCLNECQSMEVEEGNPVYDSRDNCNAIIRTEYNEIIAACCNTEIKDSIRILGRNSFQGLDSINNIELKDNIEIVKADAFYQCYSLSEITFLNPNISFELSPETYNSYDRIIDENAKIIAAKGSSAQRYADEKNQTFEPIGTQGKFVASAYIGMDVYFTLDSETGLLDVFGKGETWDYDYEDNPWVKMGDTTSAKEIVLGEGIERLGFGSFAQLENVDKITWPESIKNIDDRSLYNTGFVDVYIPKTVERVGQRVFGRCENIETITVDDENAIYSDKDSNSIIHVNDKTLVAGCQNTVIHESVKTIDLGAFEGATNLKSITLPSTLENINPIAFAETGLTTIDIPETLHFVAGGAFENCSDLETMKVYNKNLAIEEVSDGYMKVLPVETVIYGYRGCTMQTYANEWGNTFIPFPDPTTTIPTTTKQPVTTKHNNERETTKYTPPKRQKTYYYMLAKADSKGQRKIKLKWKKVKGATQYIIYGNRCHTKEKKHPLKYILSLKGNKTSYTFKKLKKHTAYKYYVEAYKGNKILTKSVVCHVITGKYKGKRANTKAVKVKKSSVKIKVGKTHKIKAKIKVYKNKKALGPQHAKPIRYVSANKFIAKVNKKGKVTGVKKGTTYIYVQAINGVWKRVKVKVKK